MVNVDFKIPELQAFPKKPDGLTPDQTVDYLIDSLRLLREDLAKLQEALKASRTDSNAMPTFGGTVTGTRDNPENALANLLTTLATQKTIVDETTAS